MSLSRPEAADTPGARPYRAFFAAALRDPAVIGGVAPSMAALGRAVAAPVATYPPDRPPVVVELGPGTGVISAAVRERLPDGARQLAVELHTGMVDYLHRELPWLEVLAGDAAELPALLGSRGIGGVDVVISGLPWSLFDAERQVRMLGAVTEVLAPDGVFSAFGYLHAAGRGSARRFHGLLRETFVEVNTAAVWRNVLPARVYDCRRLTRAGA
jgi:phospholipid N-methyltransferase